MYAALRFPIKSKFTPLNRPLVNEISNDNFHPFFKNQSISRRVIKIAVNIDVKIPIANVVAKPLIGPEPKR